MAALDPGNLKPFPLHYIDGVEGLGIVYDYMNKDQEFSYITEIDSMPWDDSIARLTQHYIHNYSYSGGPLTPADPLPPFLQTLADRVTSDDLMGKVEQGIVNQYTRKQNINAHTDRDMFGPVIISISLGADTNFIFSKMVDGKNVKIPLFVPRRSLLRLSGPARSEWKHEIPKRVTMDVPGIDGIPNRVKKSLDYRRISVTFRTVV